MRLAERVAPELTLHAAAFILKSSSKVRTLACIPNGNAISQIQNKDAKWWKMGCEVMENDRWLVCRVSVFSVFEQFKI